MTEAGERLIEGAREAVAIAKGEQPAARIHIRGHAYVPESELEYERGFVHRLQEALFFWHPGVTEDNIALFGERVADDAYLLAGYDGDLTVECAEEIRNRGIDE